MHGAPLVAALGASSGAAEPPGRLPPSGWPARADLAYIREAITTLLLLLALPWLAVNLVSRPGLVFAGAAGKHVAEPPK